MDGLVCSGSQSISYVQKSFSIFIQTDKAIYKGNDLWRFRFFSVDYKTMAYNPRGPLNYEITDPKGNLIIKNANVTFVNGKYEGSLLLSSEPSEGTWQITLTAEGQVRIFDSFKFSCFFITSTFQVFSKSVEVQKYVLPAFSATVSTPSTVLYSDRKVAVTMGAQYTFGQSVSGTFQLTFKLYGNKS